MLKWSKISKRYQRDQNNLPFLCFPSLVQHGWHGLLFQTFSARPFETCNWSTWSGSMLSLRCSCVEQVESGRVRLSCIDHSSCLKRVWICKENKAIWFCVRPNFCLYNFAFTLDRCEMLGYHGQPHTQMSQVGPTVTSFIFILSFRFISSLSVVIPRQDSKTKRNVSGRMGTATTAGHRPDQSWSCTTFCLGGL